MHIYNPIVYVNQSKTPTHNQSMAPNRIAMAEMHMELGKLMEIGLPVIVINLLNYLKGMVSVMCLGQLGLLELAGGALAVGFTNITGYSVLSGLAMGMEPVCGQAIGSGNLPLAQRVTRKTVAMLLLASLPVSLLWSNLRPVMLWLRQDPDVARVAAVYCRFAVPDLLASSVLYPIRIYLRCKGDIRPLMWCSSLAILMHLPLTVALCFRFRLGVGGVAVASCFANFNVLAFLLAYAACARTVHAAPESIVSTTTSAALLDRDEWGPLVRFALPSCLAVCLEWWWYELMTLAAGYLPNPRVALGAAAIVIQTTAFLYNFPVTLSSSASTRVANELGAGRPRAACIAASAAMAMAVAFSYLSLLLTTLGRGLWVRVFSGDPDVVRLAMSVLPLIGICELANCPQTTGCGVLRGSARPTIGAAVNLYAFYLIGAPVAAVLAFPMRYGFVGLIYGLLAAQIVCALSVIAVIFRTDWRRESMKAKDLVGISDGCFDDKVESSASDEEANYELLKANPD